MSRAKSPNTTTKRAFSLIETMVSAALVGILGSGALSLASHVFSRGADERQRALATADATATIDRISQLVSVAAPHGGAPRFCELLATTGGPLEGGAAPTGTCPERSSSNIPVAGTRLKRAVTILSSNFGGSGAYVVTVTVTGPSLAKPVVLTSMLAIGGS